LAEACGRRALIAGCAAHLIQDGLVALQYVLLPILAQVFALNYTQVGMLRAVSTSAMTLLEIPAGVLSERFGEPRLLVFGLVCAASGYLGVAFADSFYPIALAFLVAGCGAAFQHSLASALIAKSFGDAARRRALGTYNACGDLGKLVFTGGFSLAIGIGIAWNLVVTVACLLTLACAGLLPLLLRHRQPPAEKEDPAANQGAGGTWGIKHPRRFGWLCLTIFLDTLAQSVFLTFVAFLLLEKGGSETLASLSVVLALGGGMVGKFVSGLLAVRYGDRSAFRLLQLATIAGIVVMVMLPVLPILLLLPLLGVAVQGSSTVTYGALSDFVHRQRQSRGYAIMYSLSGLSAVFGPVLFGTLADLYSVGVALVILAALTGLTLLSGKVLRKSVPLAAAAH